MKLQILIVFLFSVHSLLSQTIINSAFITVGNTTLGNEVQFQVSINQLSTCDNYTISTDINYFIKSIDVIIDYNYNPACNASSFFNNETVTKSLLLEGSYNVTLKANVSVDPTLNSQQFLGTVFVSPPINSDCDSGYFPFLNGPCPPLFNAVCACNGVTYDNECFAYLESQNGTYKQSDCEYNVRTSSEDLQCDSYSIIKENFFEKYDCDINFYPGREKYFKYNHIQNNEPFDLIFSSLDTEIGVFLVRFQDNSIKCIAKSEDNKIHVQSLPNGVYYIIADRKIPGLYEISFCVTSSNYEPSSVYSFNLTPNPMINFFRISFEDQSFNSISIFDLTGRCIYNKNEIYNGIVVEPNLPVGIYIVQLINKDGNYVTKKLIIG